MGIDGAIIRYAPNGQELGVISTSGAQVSAMSAVGDEIWVAENGDVPLINRRSFEGNSIGIVSTNSARAEAIAHVEDQVWVGFGNLIGRYDLSGEHLGNVATNGAAVESLLLVPEPGTASVFFVSSALVYLLRRRGTFAR